MVVVTQPTADPNRVPELFEADAKNWLLFCGLGYFAGWCTACYLGMKYQVQLIALTDKYFEFKLRCNWFLWIFPGVLMIVGVVVYGVMIGMAAVGQVDISF